MAVRVGRRGSRRGTAGAGGLRPGAHGRVSRRVSACASRRVTGAGCCVRSITCGVAPVSEVLDFLVLKLQ